MNGSLRRWMAWASVLSIVLAGCSSTAPSPSAGTPTESSPAAAQETNGDQPAPPDVAQAGELGPDVPENVRAFVIFADTTPGPDPATPITMTATLVGESAVSSVVPASTGGSIEATAPDGTVFRLDIPGTALLFDTEITMTPIAGVEVVAESGESASIGEAVGVQLLPEGLHLLDVATLRVEPAGGAEEWAAIASDSDGGDAHLYPVTAGAGVVEMPITHFSDNVVISTDGVEIPPLVEDSTPTTEQAQLERDIVDAYADGELTDAEIDAIVDDYGRSVDWIVALAATDCGVVESGELARAGSLMHTMSATGFIDDAAVGEFQVGLAEAIENCLEELEAGDCFSPLVPVHRTRLIALTRMARLTGVSEDVYAPLVDRLSERVTEPGSGLAEAYRVEIVQSYTAESDALIATGDQAGMDEMRGEIVAIGNGEYCGRFVATSTGTFTGNTGVMTEIFIGDQECTTTWDGRQTVSAVGRVWSGSEIPDYMDPGTAGTGDLHIALYLTLPAGGVEWSDPDGDCSGGIASTVLNLDFVGEEIQGSAIGGAVPRLPAPNDGASVQDVYDYDGPGFLGPMTFQNHFTITAIAPDEVEIPPLTRGAGRATGPRGTFGAHIDGGPHAGDYEGEFAGDLDEGTVAADCTRGVEDEISFSGYDESQEPSSIYVLVYDPGSGETERFEVVITFGDGAEGADTIYIAPEFGEGSGSASAEVGQGRADMHVEGTTADGVSVALDVSCDGLQ